METQRPVGLSKTQGWEIGVRRTLPLSAIELWTRLMTPPGLGEWLGEGVPLPLGVKQHFTTKSGIRCEMRSYEEGSLIRMRWQPSDWAEPSTLQVRLTPAKSGVTLSFHHEHLPDGDQREAMRAHWARVINRLAEIRS
ncbi:MAG: SRPBCC domain-containing protein [Anaerolineae bacterium]|nr:SRPBCC domain-containing protein [Anaerolineae bacterium]